MKLWQMMHPAKDRRADPSAFACAHKAPPRWCLLINRFTHRPRHTVTLERTWNSCRFSKCVSKQVHQKHLPFTSICGACCDFYLFIFTRNESNTVPILRAVSAAHHCRPSEKGLSGGGDFIFISGSLGQAISRRLEKALCQGAVSTDSAATLFGGAHVWKDQAGALSSL